MIHSRPTFAVILLAIVVSCGAKATDITGSDSQLEIRQLQTREYDTLNKEMTLRSVVATLQDLGFIIDTADASIGTVTATRVYQEKSYETYEMRMTITVRERKNGRIAVRANARLHEEVIKNPRTYQDFFAALDKSMFLTLHQVD